MQQFVLGSLVGVVVGYVIDNERMEELRKSLLESAKEYDFSFPNNSTNKPEANRYWDLLQSRGCCGYDGPNDWIAWGKPGPPGSCCKNEKDVGTNNVCQAPFTDSCVKMYFETNLVIIIVIKVICITAIIFGLI